MDGPVGLQEVWLQVDLEEISCEAVNGVVQGQDVDFGAILDVRTSWHSDNIAQADPEIVADHTIHSDLLVGDSVVRQDDTNCLFALLALEKHGVACEKMACQVIILIWMKDCQQ